MDRHFVVKSSVRLDRGSIPVTVTGSLAESPEYWNLEFQAVEIFADNLLMFAD